MAFCTACGTKNPDDARFCGACGHALVAVGTVTPPDAQVPVPAPVVESSKLAGPVKAFDNPAELWKMYFYVSFFNIGVYFLTGSAADFLEESGGVLSWQMGFFALFIVVFLGLAYWLIKKQAVDKNRSLWLLPLIAWQVYSYIDGLSSPDLMYAESSFDYYDIYISGLPETIILIRLFLALRERTEPR